MANSIVDSILNQVPIQVTSSMAARLGGSESAVLSGLWTSIAATLGGLASRSEDRGFMDQISNLVTQSNQQSTLGTMIANPASGVEGSQVAEQGSKLASLLFGDQQSKIEQLVGRESGLGAPAGSRLMSLAVPVTAGFLSQQIRDRGLSVSSFASLVSSEGSKIQGLLPAGLGVLLSGFTVPSMSRKATEAAAGNGEGRKIFFILIALVAVGLVAWLGSHIWNPSQPAPVAPVETAAPAPGPLGHSQAARWHRAQYPATGYREQTDGLPGRPVEACRSDNVV
jgi:OmpA-OmpF porin, OOP family